MTGEAHRPNADFPILKGIDIRATHRTGPRSEWLAGWQVTLERAVAVKRLKTNLSGSFDIRGAFIAAARQAAGIVHPSALAIINIFPEQDAIVMEWCGAEPLRSLAGKLGILETVDAGLAVLDGLAALHATGRAHGNLSPGNVFRNPDGKIRMNDFFQAPLVDLLDDAERRFVAPEVLDGEGPDWRSDLYSLGRLFAYVVDPAEHSGEIKRFIAETGGADPALRAESPWTALQLMRQIKRAEEHRRGISSPTLVRRRRYQRLPAEISVRVKKHSVTPAETGAMLTKIKDIGENGVFVVTGPPMPIGAIVELEFSLPGGNGLIHAFGLVRWISEPPLVTGMGIQFVEVDVADMTTLRAYVRAKNEATP